MWAGREAATLATSTPAVVRTQGLLAALPLAMLSDYADRVPSGLPPGGQPK